MTNSPNTSQAAQEASSEQVVHAQESRDQVKEITTNQAEIAPEDQVIASAAIEMMAEVIKKNASIYISRVEEAVQQDGKKFEEVLELISSQANYDGESYGGDYESCKYLNLAGGLTGSVFSNLFSHLGLNALGSFSMTHPEPFQMVAALALKKATAEDPKLKKLVDAIASGAEKVGGEEQVAQLKLAI